jgi:hypothetical protein
MSEVLALQWQWIDLDKRRVTWPDSKTGGMTKPLGDEAHRLLAAAPRLEDSPFVCPSIFDPTKRMSDNTYHHGWRRILERAEVPHVGTHGIRHRAATDIANSGVPLKVGMALTAHKTVSMFMRYIHNEDDPVRMAADLVAARRRNVVGHQAGDVRDVPAIDVNVGHGAEVEIRPTALEATSSPAGFADGKYESRTRLGNYRPFRHRNGANRALPKGGRRSDEN